MSIVINELTGLTEFAVAGDEASAAFEARLRAASGPLNDGRGSLVRVLTQLRTDVRRPRSISADSCRSFGPRSRRLLYTPSSSSLDCQRLSRLVRVFAALSLR